MKWEEQSCNFIKYLLKNSEVVANKVLYRIAALWTLGNCIDLVPYARNFEYQSETLNISVET